MKKTYVAPELEVVILHTEDVICTSGTQVDNDVSMDDILGAELGL